MQKTYIVILLIGLTVLSLLVLLTKGQPLLVRKKIMLGLLIMSLTSPAAVIVSCRSGSVAQKDIWESGGWVDGNTFRAVSAGVPKQGLKNENQMKATAREAAILMAQKIIVEKFQSAVIESCGGMRDFEINPYVFIKEAAPVIKNGKVIAERYTDGSVCEIVYEVTYKDLKKKVDAQDMR